MGALDFFNVRCTSCGRCVESFEITVEPELEDAPPGESGVSEGGRGEAGERRFGGVGMEDGDFLTDPPPEECTESSLESSSVDSTSFSTEAPPPCSYSSSSSAAFLM